jgi:hypothetical protein
MLDAEWGNSKAADWVLITTTVTETQRSVAAILWNLKVSIAEAQGQARPLIPAGPRGATLHICRNTNYVEMKVQWAAGGPPDGMGFCPATVDDEAKARALLTNWPESEDVAFIRPATDAEVARHDQKLREDAEYRIITSVFEKWGFDDEGQPLDHDGDGTRPFGGLEPDETRQRRNNAHEEISRTLRERGLS